VTKPTTTTVQAIIGWRDALAALQNIVITCDCGEIPRRDADTLRQVADVIEDMAREVKKGNKAQP
jgi:hypothetical protein